ncbi:MAG: ABC transporter permease [Actinomycetota bacterium]|nr:ABC transporter permease [Actinomycetota bacterium]
MSDSALALRQVRFTNKAFWRNPASAFFTFAFPLMFLIIFTSLLGNDSTTFGNATITNATYYVFAMAAFGVITACYTNIAMSVSFQRDAGVLKRTRGTPLPAWAYLFGRVVHAMLVAALLVIITLVFGKIFYSSALPTGRPLAEFVLTFVVGALTFSALGLAMTSVVPNADAAPPIVNASILPLLFLSGIFIPLGDDAPAWVRTVGTVFPVKHFIDAMRASYLGNLRICAPPTTSPRCLSVPAFHFHWIDLVVIAVWGFAGLVLASRFFSWEPRR